MSKFSENLLELPCFSKSVSVQKKIEFITQIDLHDTDVLYAIYYFLENKILKHKELPDCVDGTLYKVLINSSNLQISNLIKDNFIDGLLPLNSTFYLHHSRLQDLLLKDNFQEADKFTATFLCLLADLKDRNWLYFSDVSKIAGLDLQIIDNMWKIYSQGKFGFSIQKQIWLNNNCNWDLLWDKLGWRKDNVLCRYPTDFVWNLNAPVGHLPLSNQLRGFQTLKALLNLDIWG
uniref:Conserved hypothetical plastid protein n=1 Tax=Rhodochaete parvula TaxID=110510 RepID=A0A1X9PV70_9RHOD|nr:conserved hypothetical plastid protein [Rhodochaete parvula]ASK39709.1 hypothetical protein Rhodc_177 [Rhodochaete parvula]